MQRRRFRVERVKKFEKLLERAKKRGISRERLEERIKVFGRIVWLRKWREMNFEEKVEFAERRYGVKKISRKVIEVLRELEKGKIGYMIIGRIKGKKFVVALPWLYELSFSKNWGVREDVAYALGRIGVWNKDVKLVLEKLSGDRHGDVRKGVAKALENIGVWNVDAMRILERLSEDQYQKVRESAAKALGKINVANKDKKLAMRILNKLSTDRDVNVKKSAKASLKKLQIKTPVQLSFNFQLLEWQKKKFEDRVEFARRRYRVKVGEEIKKMLKELDKGKIDWSVIERIKGKKFVVALPWLYELSFSKDAGVRVMVAYALGNIGVWNEDVAEILGRLGSDANWKVRYGVADNIVLGYVAPWNDIKEMLEKLSRDMHPRVRYATAWTLAAVGARAWNNRVKEMLEKLSRDENEEVRRGVILALGEYKVWNRTAMMILKKSLEDREAVRTDVAEALGDIGIWNEDVAEMLSALSEDRSEQVRKAVAEALGKVSWNRAVKAMLEELSKNRSWRVRGAAARASGKIHITSEKDRKSVIEILRRLRKDENSAVREAASWSLAKVLREKGKIAQLGVEERELVKWLGIWPKLSFEKKLKFVEKRYKVRVSEKVKKALKELDRGGVDWFVVIERIRGDEYVVALPWLWESSFSRNYEVRKKIALALGRIGVWNEDVAEILERLGSDENKEVRKAAIDTLWKFAFGRDWEKVQKEFERIEDKRIIVLIGFANGKFDRRKFLKDWRYREQLLNLVKAMSVEKLREFVFGKK